MAKTPNFVVIDFHHESRYLLVKTLRRKFPEAVIHESDDAAKAIEIARAVNLAAIITHRTFDIEGIELVRRLRDADPDVPIIMVSGIDRGTQAVEAGATCFLDYDSWLRIGSIVETHMRHSTAGGGGGSAVA
jgi:DNA-binding NarL/FixJ family response regulator